ncbi:polyhydroxyalkanoate synthesis repressor PhaR [Arenibaculum pallidiluteum]|uniref:polyhydroxyalkanoate synthesis repressor PhaR n=1 Tax=Arenibaculum pallidiluteum TaxID=2812559 RepID=UPI001A975C13|nr:polyhydroxyalkanoate synthesis repressor PhaR [Arenibaculum pallidiluteum]
MTKAAPTAEKEDPRTAPITIKKYANRRLYNTATSSYVTLDHLCQMVKDGKDFVVYDAKTGEDITRSVLTQIIVEEESKGQNLLPISFLRQLIGFYGDNMQWVVPRYLEYSMQALARNQEQMRDYFQNTLGGMFPFGTFEEMGKQNLAMFERAMRMFSPFGPGEAGKGEEGEAGRGKPDSEKALEEMQQRLAEMQRQLASLGSRKSGE